MNIFWGDERYVPHDDPASNYRLAAETLLNRVPIPKQQVYPMPTWPAAPDEVGRRAPGAVVQDGAPRDLIQRQDVTAGQYQP